MTHQHSLQPPPKPLARKLDELLDAFWPLTYRTKEGDQVRIVIQDLFSRVQRGEWQANAERDQAIAERDEAISNAKAERGRLTTAINDATEAALQSAAPDRTVPDGWALVPVEPTNAMVDALYGPIDERPYGPFAQMHYAEMLAAAPPPPDVERQS